MEDYPEDKSWWKKVSVTDFLSVAKFGPVTKADFEEFLASKTGRFGERGIRYYAETDMETMFGREELLEWERHSVNDLVKLWILARRDFDNRELSAEEKKKVRGLATALSSTTAETEERQGDTDYLRAASAFEISELSTTTGHFASDAVHRELLGQYTSYCKSMARYIAPYTTVVGPSGIGKSFSVKQLAMRHGLYVVYSNLAPSTGQGYPRPVVMGKAPIRTKMEDESKMVSEWEVYLKAQVAMANSCREAGITPAGLFALLTSLKGDIPFIRGRLQEHYGAKGTGEGTDWQLVKAALETLGLNKPPSLPSVAPNTPNAPNAPIVLCFDEARALLDDNAISFRRLRTAAANCFAGHPFFLVLLDTTSRITNFTPPLRQDPSAKTKNKSLFNPIFQMDTFNLFSHHGRDLEPTGGDDAMGQWLSYGRPLWGAFLQAGDSWQDLVHFAMGKIGAQTDRLAYGIALLAYRMVFYVCSSTLAETLVAASMRCIVSIAQDRDNIITTQPSEPVLALAASRLLSVSATRLEAIRAWIHALRAGLVNPGDVGEQVASLVLLFAADAAAAPPAAARQQRRDATLVTDAPTAIPFARLMTALLGDEAWQTVREQNHRPATQDILGMGSVFVTHFVRATTAPTRDVLESAYRRGTALFLPCNFPGADVILPIRMPEGGMAALLIQIKNRRDDSATPGLTLYMNEAMAKAKEKLGLSLGPSGDLQGMVGLVMCLRTHHKEPKFVPALPHVPEPRPRAKRTRKGKEKEVDVVPESVELLGMAFGLDLSLYPSMKTPGASSSDELRDADDICQLLQDLLATWPDAFSKEDIDSVYAQRLLNPFYDV